jgi:hypothetical protein
MSDSPLETETTSDGTTTFEHFDREWTVPTRRHLSHIKAMRDGLQVPYTSANLVVAETFLTAGQFDALLEVDPDEDALNEFVGKISKALGVGDSGNS